MPTNLGPEFKTPQRFKIQRRLGEGGFGVVYEAWDQERDALIALKALHRFDPGALYRFKREFRTLADLAHPNLVTLYELISEWEQWFLAMELIRGVNFFDYVRAPHASSQHPSSSVTMTPSVTGATAATMSSVDPVDANAPAERPAFVHPLNPDRLRAGLRQLAGAVHFLHRQGILHRDIKPSNVLVTPEGRVVLLDFGLATGFAPEERSDSVHLIGTPEYMSPEQAAGHMLTEASDWYSVGVVLYRALTGRLPFSGSFLTMLLEKQQRDPIAPIQLVPSVASDLDVLCRDLLRRDPASRPSGPEILARLGDGSLSGAAAAPSLGPREALPFVARQQQLAALKEALEETRSGKTVMLHVRGSSGMGKTALVRHFLRRVRETDRDIVLLTGRCYEREAVPYKALDSLVDSLTDYLKKLPQPEAESLLPRGVEALARVFPVLDRVDALTATKRRVSDVRDLHELRRRASAAFRELLGRIAERHALILFIDDVQWGDVDSATLLSELLTPPDQPALLLIVCYRAEEAETSPMLRALLAAKSEAAATTDVRTVDVGELTRDEAEALAHTLIGDDHASRERATVIAREANGSPFFIDQLVRHGLRESEDASLDTVLRNRVSDLTDASRTLLEVTAVAGRPLELAVANQAADLESGNYDVIASLLATHFIRTRLTADRREIEPYHDRIRETIVASLAPDSLKRYHQRLALALERSANADPEALAVHFQAAGDTGKAAHYALAAADRASAALAFERAARLYRLALDLQPPHAERRPLSVKLGDALANAGRVIEAAQAYLTAAHLSEPAARTELRRQAAEQFLMGGHLDEGFTLLRSVLAAAGVKLPATARRALLLILLRRPYMLLRGTRFRERSEDEIPPRELGRIDLCHSAVRSLGFTETIYAIEFQMRHLLLALKVGEPYRVARALGFEAIADARHRRGRARAERLLSIARNLAERIPKRHQADASANIRVTAGMLAFLAGHWKNAWIELQQAEQIFREQSALPYKIVVCQVYTLSAFYHAGEMSEYFRRIPECLKESVDRGNVFAEANFRLQNSHRKCFGDDDPDGALEELKEAMARWSPRGFHQVHATELFLRGDFALYRGDARTAWDGICERWAPLSKSFLLGLETIHVPALYLRARAALAMAATDDRSPNAFLKAAERDARRIERERTHWGHPLAQMVRACVAIHRSDAGGAATRLAAAEAAFEVENMALHAAVARSRRGSLIGGDEGRHLVHRAQQWMASQGLKNPARMIAMLAPGRWEEH